MKLTKEQLANLSGVLASKQSDPRKRCVFLCNRTANAMQPWADSGYLCVSFDLQHKGCLYDSNYWFVEADILDVVEAFVLPNWFGIAFPDCTHLAGSGALHWKGKGLEPLIQGLDLVFACERFLKSNSLKWVIENPVGRLATLWRPFDHSFNPNDYGDPYKKKTCLWTSDSFTMPEKKPVSVIDPNYIHYLGGKDRKNKRSITPPGFCQALFDANNADSV